MLRAAGHSVTIAYACEAGAGRGWGHLERGRSLLELADAGSALLVGRGYEEAVCLLRGSAVRVLPWTSDAPCDIAACPWDALVVDDYEVAAGWLEESARHRPTFVVDDWMRQRLCATGLINVNLGAEPADYEEVRVRRWLLGPKYAMIRSAIRRMGRAGVYEGPVREILVTLGGSDPDGRTAEVVADLVESEWFARDGRIVIVLGGSFAGPRPWDGWPAEHRSRITVVQQPADFPRLLREAHLAICGASTVSYELAFLGTPFIPLAFVDNQAVLVERWKRLGVGDAICTWQPEWRRSLAGMVDAVAFDAQLRTDLTWRARGCVDGAGAERVMAAIREECAA